MSNVTPPIIFADDFIEHDAVAWRIEPGIKDPNNPLIEPKYPWDLGCTFSHGTVLRDPIDGLWKAWYLSTPPLYDDRKGAEDRQLTYAFSHDGVEWIRPELDIYPCGGFEKTNILLGSKMGGQVSQVSVDIVPDAEPEHRYEMFCLRDPQYYEFQSPGYGCPDQLIAGFPLPPGRDHHFYGLYRHFSADGIHWNVAEGPLATGWYVLPLLPEGYNPITTSDGIYVYRWGGKYYMFSKVELPAIPGNFVPHDSGFKLCRTIALRVSEDGSHWEEPYEHLLTPDYLDPPDTQFMELAVSPYPENSFGNHAGFMAGATVYHTSSSTIDVQFAASRNGKKWWRPARRSCIELAPLGDIGGGMIWPTRGFVFDGDQTHLYYSGLRGLHGDTYSMTRTSGAFHGAFCRASWETGRYWAAMHFEGLSYYPCILTTPPLDCGGKNLIINAATDCEGKLQAELLDEQGRVISGYSREECRAFVGDEKNAVLGWQGRERCSVPRASLRFIMRNTRLYGFEWR